MLDLPVIWAALIAFAVLAYVVLDGFDLGIGILSPWLGGRSDRQLAINSIAPVWDGNETWLVLGGGGLLAVFPLAYAVVLPALYPLIIAMLLGLIFRGVAFEFVHRTRRWRGLWERGFFAGSLVAALAQGLALGALVKGLPVAERAFDGGPLEWLSPFSLLVALALVAGYATLGSTWLILKTEGSLQERARRLATRLGPVFVVAIGAVSLATIFVRPEYMDRWFGWPALLYSLVVPILVVVAAALLWTGIRSKRESQPFLAALALFLLSYAGLGISFYPYIVPPSLTIHEAAAPEESLQFLLVGAAVLIPMILAYTGYSYWVFRGKVRAGDGYH